MQPVPVWVSWEGWREVLLSPLMLWRYMCAELRTVEQDGDHTTERSDTMDSADEVARAKVCRRCCAAEIGMGHPHAYYRSKLDTS